MELDNHILETVKLKKCLLVKQLYKIYGEKMGVSYPTFIKRLRSIDSLRIGPLVSDSKVLFAYIDRRISFQKAVLGAMLQAYTELSGEDAWFAISSSALPGFYSSLIKNASNLNRNYLDILENDRAFWLFHNQRAKETLPGSPSYVSRLEKESDSDYYSRLTPSPRLLDVPMSLNNLLSRYIYLDYRKSKNELVFRCFDVMNWLLPEQFYQHIAMIIDLMARYGLSTLPGIKTSIIFYCFSESSKTRYSDMFKLDTARIMKVYSKSPYVRMRDDVLNASNWSISFVSLDVSNYFHDIPYGYTKMSKKA